MGYRPPAPKSTVSIDQKPTIHEQSKPASRWVHAKLYAIEKEIRGMAPEDRAAIQQARAKPIFDTLKDRLQT